MINKALALGLRGLSVFPITPLRKYPPLVAWKSQATTIPGVLEQWWEQWPDANIGVATGKRSGVFVLDVDMKKGKNGEASLRRLEAKHGPLPATVETITPHGGRQIWFKMPDCEVKCSVDKLGEGLDIRGDGGYVVVPPSQVSDEDGAGDYTWSVDSAKAFAEAPAWLITLLTTTPVADLDARRTNEHWRRIVCDGAAEGARNTTAASLTGWLLRLGLDVHTTAQIVLGWNARSNRPPLADDEVMTIVRSIASRELMRLEGR